MSNEIIIGAGVKVEIGLTESAAVSVNSITKSTAPLATAQNHGLADASAAYFTSMVGMEQMDGQAVRVQTQGSPGDDDFTFLDINTTNFATFTSGQVVGVATWATLAQSTQYAIGGGAGKTEDVGTLFDTTEKLLTIKNAAETVTIDVRSLREDNTAMAKVRSTARALGNLVFRITHPPAAGQTTGAQRIFRGQPSIPGESVAQGGTGTGQLSVTIKGQVCYLPGV